MRESIPHLVVTGVCECGCAVARGGGRHLGDRPHGHRVVVAPGEQRLAGRRAQRGGVKACELEAALGELLGRRHRARSPERRRGPEADVVDQHDEHVGRALSVGGAARWAGRRCWDPWRRRWSDPRASGRRSAGRRAAALRSDPSPAPLRSAGPEHRPTRLRTTSPTWGDLSPTVSHTNRPRGTRDRRVCDFPDEFSRSCISCKIRYSGSEHRVADASPRPSAYTGGGGRCVRQRR